MGKQVVTQTVNVSVTQSAGFWGYILLLLALPLWLAIELMVFGVWLSFAIAELAIWAYRTYWSKKEEVEES